MCRNRVFPRFAVADASSSVSAEPDWPIRRKETQESGGHMLWTIAVILLILWALGMVSSYTLGGFIHLLLLLAIIVILIRVIQGRSPVV